MKKILITGKNSYVGKSLEKWLENYSERYLIDTISLRGDSWKDKNFSGYDVVVHVVGIAHIKETRGNADLYYKVNRDLAFEVAQKAKVEGVNQFIFLSSMSVYGIENGVIGKKTQLKPLSNYGKSKLQAEKLISSLEEDFFKVVILRPPMIYGKGCKGNYTRLAKLTMKTPFFPKIDNKRSMIYIYNLCEFIRLVIEDSSKGLFFPQNEEYVCTSEMVKVIAEINGKKIWFTKLFNPFLGLFKLTLVQKVFGNLVYEKELSIYSKQYCMFSFTNSLKKTEVN